jgi:hypothetical protein
VENPVHDLITWLKSQERDVQSDVAFLMSGMNPAFDFNNTLTDIDKMSEHFYSQIESFSGSEAQNVGFLISFIAVFDFLFKSRGTPEGWETPKEMFQSVLENSDTSDSMKKITNDLLSKLPVKMEQWAEICKQWQELKDTKLSESVIEKWNNSNMLTWRSSLKTPIKKNLTVYT